jgi:acyl carrier protein
MLLIDDLIGTVSKITGIPEGELAAETGLYGSELVSSLMMLEIMAAVEKNFGIYIRPEELIADNFSDIGRLRDFIERKQRENAAS